MNKTETNTVAELVERRVSAKRNAGARPESGTQRPELSEDGLTRIRAAARKDKRMRFNNLFHHLTPDLLHLAYLALERRAVPGVDGVNWSQYGEALDENLTALHQRLHTGQYRAQPVQRKWIDKPTGGQRPLGITCVEDKIVQQAVVWVLESIYEVDFRGFSYGSRPGKSPHRALDALYMAITTKKVSYVLDADIQGYYDNIDQHWLMRFMEHRISDRRILKLIKQTVQAGIIDQGQWQPSVSGIPQGSLCKALHNEPYA